jgi:glucosamine--fructose-6-phosphate aminotransferase (isomerizing)
VSAKAARDAGALVVAIVNDPDTPLADIAEVTIPMLAGPERSVAATKSYIASLLALTHLVAAWTADEELEQALANAPAALAAAWALDWSAALPPLTRATNLYVLGRGLSLGVAQEAALKLKETCGLHAESYSAAEVKHGPMAIVGAGFPVLMLVPNDEARDAFEPLASDFVRARAEVMITCESILGASSCRSCRASTRPSRRSRPIQSFYRMATSSASRAASIRTSRRTSRRSPKPDERLCHPSQPRADADGFEADRYVLVESGRIAAVGAAAECPAHVRISNSRETSSPASSISR